MATATQRERLRLDIGATVSSLPDLEADAIYEEAGESYTDTASLNIYARVIGLRRILASSAKLTSYAQNESRENLSDVFKHVKELLLMWEETLAVAEGGAEGAVRSGRQVHSPDYRNDWPYRP
jgi:hypothetical protein